MPAAPLTEEEILQVVDYAWTLVPDSMMAGLREMQRMAEMGMDMSRMMGGTGTTEGTPAMDQDAMDHSGMDHGAMDHSAARDTSPR
jgi:hypothetical protein